MRSKVIFIVLAMLLNSGCARINFYDSSPSKSYSGIESAKIQDSNLLLTMIDKGLFEEFAAPADHFYTGSYTSTPRPNTDQKVKTGKSEWKEAYKNHKVVVSGFDKSYEFFVVNNYQKLLKEIDLREPILNSDVSNEITIRVTCIDCNTFGTEEQSLFGKAKASVELKHDFKIIKAALQKVKEREFKEEEAIRLKKEKLEKEVSDCKALEEREAIKVETLKKVNLEEYKAQCIELGFKFGTSDFGNCVLELNNNK